MQEELKKLREKSFALSEDVHRVETDIGKVLETGRLSKAKKIIDNLISETKDTKTALFNMLIKDQQEEDYEEAQQALILYNFTTEIESKLYSLKDRKRI
jgi:hypothetical protein